jgi:site-specific DNA-methyltransferase (adenine-specific)
VLGKPFIGEPQTACTETYLYVGPFADEQIARNAQTYMTTRFFRFLVLLNKPSQDAPRRVYALVPMQDFSRPWTDADLYEKYGITDEEIAFIESMIRPMDAAVA